MEVAVIAAITLGALAVVLYPLLTRGSKERLAALSEEALDEEVARYREAIKRGTLCDRCLAANPAGSRFCADCGRPL